MAAAKRVLRYLCSTSGMGLVLGGQSPVVLTCHADASWADDQATQWSSQGYTFSLGSGSVSWRATRSSSVLGSSCEAEIYAGAMAAQELRWLTYLLTDLGEPPRSPPVLYVDNKAMLALCREQRLEHRTKHIALRYFLARELQYVASEANTADVFTKALAPCDHQRFCTQLGLCVACSVCPRVFFSMAQDTPSAAPSGAGGEQGERAGEGKGTHARMGADGCFVLRTGASMPAIGLGTWLEGDGGEQTQEAVRVALQCGYRSIDCAHLYGTEMAVGRALAEAFSAGVCTRDDVFLASKVWCTTSNASRVLQACERALKNLCVAQLDLFLLSWPLASPLNRTPADATDPPVSSPRRGQVSLNVAELWAGMEQLVASGRVKAIGVANFSAPMVLDLLHHAHVQPAVVQAEIHPLWRQEQLLSVCHANGIHVSAHTPLGTPGVAPLALSSQEQAEMNLWSVPAPAGKGRSRTVHGPMLRHYAVQDVAQQHGKTPAQVILRWALQRGTSVLPVSVREQRIRSNYDLLDWSLSHEEWERMSAIEPQIPLLGPCLAPASSLPNSTSTGGRPETFQEEEEEVAGEEGDKGKEGQG
ncbi:unnamed protein product [Closterium sp. NIES-54]